MNLTREQKALLDRVAPLPLAEPTPLRRPRSVRTDDDDTPDVCVCDIPRFAGPCNCGRRNALHMPNECRSCHRPVLTIDSE